MSTTKKLIKLFLSGIICLSAFSTAAQSINSFKRNYQIANATSSQFVALPGENTTVLCGSFSDTSSKIGIIYLDSLGSILGANCFSYEGSVVKTCRTRDGSIIILSSMNGISTIDLRVDRVFPFSNTATSIQIGIGYNLNTQFTVSTLDSGFVIGGVFLDSLNNETVYMVKFNKYNQLVYSRCLLGFKFSFGIHACNTSDNAVVLAGTAVDTIIGTWVPYCVKVDEFGTIVFGNEYLSAEGESNDIAANSIGGINLTYIACDGDGSGYIKTDSIGNILLSKRWLFPYIWNLKIVKGPYEPLVFTGLCPDSLFNPNYCVFNVDSAANFLWGNLTPDLLDTLFQLTDSTFLINSGLAFGKTGQQCISPCNTTIPFTITSDDYLPTVSTLINMYSRTDNYSTRNYTLDTLLVSSITECYSNSTNIFIYTRSDVQIYPNPATDNLIIDCGSNYAGLSGYSIRITNLLGQTVYNNPVTAQVTNIQLTLPTWVNGTYVVQFINPQGTVLDTKRIIIQ